MVDYDLLRASFPFVTTSNVIHDKLLLTYEHDSSKWSTMLFVIFLEPQCVGPSSRIEFNTKAVGSCITLKIH